MTADEMREVAQQARERLGREVCELMLMRGVRGTTRKDRANMKREIDMRKRWLALLDRVAAAETSMDADTEIDGLFIAGTGVANVG